MRLTVGNSTIDGKTGERGTRPHANRKPGADAGLSQREHRNDGGLVATAEGLARDVERGSLRRQRDGLRDEHVRGRLRVAVLQVAVEFRRERRGGAEDEDGGEDGL